MSHWHHQLYMSAAVTAHFLFCYLHTASVADNSLVAYPFIFSTSALIILSRTKDTLTEQAVTLRLVGAVVDCLWFGHLAIGILKYFLW